MAPTWLAVVRRRICPFSVSRLYCMVKKRLQFVLTCVMNCVVVITGEMNREDTK